MVLNENKHVFENFWDWIVGDVSPGTRENGVLTVTNTRKLGSWMSMMALMRLRTKRKPPGNQKSAAAAQ